jgi:hypothetical protein
VTLAVGSPRTMNLRSLLVGSDLRASHRSWTAHGLTGSYSESYTPVWEVSGCRSLVAIVLVSAARKVHERYTEK